MKLSLIAALLFISFSSFSQPKSDTPHASVEKKDTAFIYVVHRIDTVKVDIIYKDGETKGTVKFMTGYAIRSYDFCEAWPEKAKNVSSVLYDDKFKRFTKKIISVQ